MKRIHIRRARLSLPRLALHLALAACMPLLNCALPRREPLSFALLFAALACGAEPFSMSAGYLVSALTARAWAGMLSAAVQTAIMLLACVISRRMKVRSGRVLLLCAACLAQLPFLLLFPHSGYPLPLPLFGQKAVLALIMLALALLFSLALHALLHEAFRCRLQAGKLACIVLLWTVTGLGALSAFAGWSEPLFRLAALTLLLFGTLLLKSAAALPFAVVLAFPLALARVSALPIAAFALFACAALLFVPYGRVAAALSFALAALLERYLAGAFGGSALTVLLALLPCLLPALIACLMPERAYARLRRTLLFYRERTLPRMAINRNRRAVGQQLYEISALFREIGTAFEGEEGEDGSARLLRESLERTLCASCANCKRCRDAHMGESLDKLIAVGRAKGRVNLIDLPETLSSLCTNCAGLLFALNKQLAEYRRYAAQREAAREGRALLSRQARGVSEILKDIALEQSEEYTFTEGERALGEALAAAGLLSSEIFLYGEGAQFTATMTLEERADAKKVCEAASRALGMPLTLREKIPLTRERACFVFKRKAHFDAAFGLAGLPKEGVEASGDTHSVLKIDERRFLVALSDGMGSGEEARAVSDRTLSLLESFYKAKMPSELILSTVNNLLSFSANERFSCIDLAAVDLDTGSADVVKIGSPTSFVLSQGELRVLEGESLPIGVLDSIRPTTLRVNLQEDDFLLFLSDGITTAFGSSADLCAYLSTLSPVNPQSLAETLLSAALERYHGRAEDDMTVLAVKLTKAA